MHPVRRRVCRQFPCLLAPSFFLAKAELDNIARRAFHPLRGLPNFVSFGPTEQARTSRCATQALSQNWPADQ